MQLYLGIDVALTGREHAKVCALFHKYHHWEWGPNGKTFACRPPTNAGSAPSPAMSGITGKFVADIISLNRFNRLPRIALISCLKRLTSHIIFCPRNTSPPTEIQWKIVKRHLHNCCFISVTAIQSASATTDFCQRIWAVLKSAQNYWKWNRFGRKCWRRQSKSNLLVNNIFVFFFYSSTMPATKGYAPECNSVLIQLFPVKAPCYYVLNEMNCAIRFRKTVYICTSSPVLRWVRRDLHSTFLFTTVHQTTSGHASSSSVPAVFPTKSSRCDTPAHHARGSDAFTRPKQRFALYHISP